MNTHSRREILVAGAAIAAASALPAAADDTATSPARALALCIEAGNTCMQHCLTLLASGDKSLGDCATAVHQMLAVCNAMTVLVASGTRHLKAAAALCVDVCGDCEKACRVHAEHHAQCKACADACAATIAAVRKLAA